MVIAVLSFDHNTLVDKGETGSVTVAGQISRFPDIHPPVLEFKIFALPDSLLKNESFRGTLV